MNAKTLVKQLVNAKVDQTLIFNDKGRKLSIVVEPNEDGWEFGYIGVCNGYTIKSFNRLDIISQFLLRYWVGN